MPPVKAEKPHHHGDLRAALIKAGLEILTESGLDALTLRACAARAGVSHSAPAHHFGNLPGLLTAIATRGFESFTATLDRARSSAPPDPRAQVLGICHGYLEFARANPALFTLMFNAKSQLAPNDAFRHAAGASYDILARTCAPFRPISGNPNSTEIMIWSLVHGLASLQQGGHFQLEGDPVDMPSFEDILPDLTLRDDTGIT